MHIAEGVLSGPVLAVGAGISGICTVWGLRGLTDARVAEAAVLAAAFFVASLIHVPIGPVHVHLLLNGLVGLLLGWAAFPVILAALVLQAVFFQFGGITTLGINGIALALPAVLVFFLFRRPVASNRRSVHLAGAFAAGALAVLLAAVLAALALSFSGRAFLPAARVLFVAALPLMVVEGLITALCVGFLHRVRPTLFSTIEF